MEGNATEQGHHAVGDAGAMLQDASMSPAASLQRAAHLAACLACCSPSCMPAWRMLGAVQLGDCQQTSPSPHQGRMNPLSEKASPSVPFSIAERIVAFPALQTVEVASIRLCFNASYEHDIAAMRLLLKHRTRSRVFIQPPTNESNPRRGQGNG